MDIKSLVPGQVKADFNRSEKARKKSQSGGSTAADEADDSVSLTGKASQIGQLIQQMKAAPVVDQSRVEPLKDKLDKKQYEIEYQRVANKMLDFESNFQGY
ncbi:flagellar biosynthesis anti-sigma factor FlgM [Aliikangiella sp. IMCC44653]